jgi:pyruvate/2-oxoglutarate dehydrogenase complex dihydrolipoamide acyltransferase (E2) component
MAEPVVMPKAGLTMESGEVLEWLVPVGDEVEAGQPIVQVGTYKADIDVESPVAGVLLAALEPGTEVPPGAIIGVVGRADEDISGISLGAPSGEVPEVDVTADSAAEPQADPRPRPKPEQGGERRSVSPAARKRAFELGVDIDAVEAAGPSPRVRVEDVERAAAEGER